MLNEKPIGIYATEIQCDQNIKMMKKPDDNKYEKSAIRAILRT